MGNCQGREVKGARLSSQCGQQGCRPSDASVSCERTHGLFQPFPVNRSTRGMRWPPCRVRTSSLARCFVTVFRQAQMARRLRASNRRTRHAGTTLQPSINGCIAGR